MIKTYKLYCSFAFQVLQERKVEYKKRKAEEAALKARKESGVVDAADDTYRNYRYNSSFPFANNSIINAWERSLSPNVATVQAT